MRITQLKIPTRDGTAAAYLVLDFVPSVNAKDFALIGEVWAIAVEAVKGHLKALDMNSREDDPADTE